MTAKSITTFSVEESTAKHKGDIWWEHPNVDSFYSRKAAIAFAKKEQDSTKFYKYRVIEKKRESDLAMTIESIPRFCLTLPEKPHRRIVARNHFNDSGLHGVTFVNGINGELSGLKTVHPYAVDDKSGNFKTGHHEAGIFLSHLMLWQHVALTHDHALIMEDDCQLHPLWKMRLTRALQDVPQDFDWLFCGSCGTVGRNFGRIMGEVYDVRYPSCFHMYVVSRRGANILCDTQRKVWGPIDITVYHADPLGGSMTAFDKMKVLTILPRIADQRNTEIPD